MMNWKNATMMLVVLGGGSVGIAAAKDYLTFRGAADASAAVALDANTVVVADDETNQLRLYDVRNPGDPIGQVDLTDVAVIEREHPELDLEGAARYGDRVYWIGSHGRNKDGKRRPNRLCLSAMEVKQGAKGPTLVPVGRVYRDLLEALLRQPAIKPLHLDRTVRLPATFETSKKHRTRLAPKKEGVNIEALAVLPGGQGIYIGFRNPRPVDPADGKAKALVMALTNIHAVLNEEAGPQFSPPILLDLRGKGLRSMDYCSDRKEYLLIAGDHDGRSDDFVLYRWSGKPQDVPEAIRSFGPPHHDLNIEALVPFPDQNRILLLSDDGTRKRKIDGIMKVNKELADVRQRTFRGLWYVLDAGN